VVLTDDFPGVTKKDETNTQGGECQENGKWTRLWGRGALAYSVATEGAMDEKVVCILCDKPEYDCKCDRYCAVCQGQQGIRLCNDGRYYCPDCREAMEIHVVDYRA